MSAVQSEAFAHSKCKYEWDEECNIQTVPQVIEVWKMWKNLGGRKGGRNEKKNVRTGIGEKLLRSVKFQIPLVANALFKNTVKTTTGNDKICGLHNDAEEKFSSLQLFKVSSQLMLFFPSNPLLLFKISFIESLFS